MISKTHEKNFKQSRNINGEINPYTVYLYPYIGPYIGHSLLDCMYHFC